MGIEFMEWREQAIKFILVVVKSFYLVAC